MTPFTLVEIGIVTLGNSRENSARENKFLLPLLKHGNFGLNVLISHLTYQVVLFNHLDCCRFFLLAPKYRRNSVVCIPLLVAMVAI